MRANRFGRCLYPVGRRLLSIAITLTQYETVTVVAQGWVPLRCRLQARYSVYSGQEVRDKAETLWRLGVGSHGATTSWYEVVNSSLLPSQTTRKSNRHPIPSFDFGHLLSGSNGTVPTRLRHWASVSSIPQQVQHVVIFVFASN